MQEVVQHGLRRRRARHVVDRHVAHFLVHGGDDARGRHARIDHEAQAPAPLPRLALALAEDRDAAFHDHAVRDDDRLPVARLDEGRAPADVAHLALDLVDAHPVADLHGVVDLDRESAEHVAEGVLHGEGDDRGEDGGGGDETREVDAGAAQLDEAVHHIGDQDHQVLDDARPFAAHHRQHQAEDGEAQQADGPDGGDDAEDGLQHRRGAGERERVEDEGEALAEDADQEQPQGVEIHAALVRPEAKQERGQREREHREPADFGMQQIRQL